MLHLLEVIAISGKSFCEQKLLPEMLNFDLMDTVAGKQLFDMGQQKVIEALRETVLEVLNIRFEIVSNDLLDKIRAITQVDNLKKLHSDALRCPDLDSFKGKLS